MEVRTLLFLVCLPALITGTPSKQAKHDFKSTLRHNMKGYFKSYTLGNFKGVYDKEFYRLKISKWLSEDVSENTPHVHEETERPLLAAKQEPGLTQEWLNNAKPTEPQLLANFKHQGTDQPLLAAKREQLSIQEWLNNEKPTEPQLLANFKYEETERPLLAAKREKQSVQEWLNNAKPTEPQLLANFKYEETERPLLAAKREKQSVQEWLNNAKPTEPQLLANFKYEETERPLLAAKREKQSVQEWLNNAKPTEPQLLANFKYEETERPLLAAKREKQSVQEWLNNAKPTEPQLLANFKYEETERPLLAAKREQLSQEWLNNAKPTEPQLLANFKYEETERPLLAAKREQLSQEWLNNAKPTEPQLLANFKYEETERPLLAAKREKQSVQEWLNNAKPTEPQLLANFKYEETERPLLAAKREKQSVQEWLNNAKPTEPQLLANFKYEETERPLLAAKREQMSIKEWLNNEKPTEPQLLANFKYEETERPLLAAKQDQELKHEWLNNANPSGPQLLGNLMGEGTIRPLLSAQREQQLSYRPVQGSSDGKMENTEGILAWLRAASGLRQAPSDDIDFSLQSFIDVLNISPDGCSAAHKLPMSAHHADISLLGVTPVFMNLFWPFRFDMNVMNQRLAAYGLTNKVISGNNETLKEDFFRELQEVQGMRLPVKGNQMVLSFGDEDVVDGLKRINIVPDAEAYTRAGKHLYTREEQARIRLLANKALDLINKTHEELYSAMVQMVSCIAFFKDESDKYTSGTVNSALGVIWLDPRDDWTVPLMAEQIVHEFIHTTLFYTELVQGGYKDISRVTEALVLSAIRQEPRQFDRSLHAAYVSAGLITFHTRAGFFDRAAKLAQTMPEAVQELNRVNAETDVLDEAGRAMLNFLTEYVCLTRM
ncbi:uncharacterized protein LOC124281676 isoform X2 [Haliotis rubra]|uniref:uncharacterized protein LOC124281676 isoform X2 n=1 Tax=Haliotis rubra TaxID=36100 RepID=UPI001EE5434B|nr:uncharacterized protein LOC124281676 isoform X2 [Haliotis rubra]